jgi:SAM-dependent methyltransferase
MIANSPEELEKIYNRRFSNTAIYRNRVWKILCKFFQKYIPIEGNVLDLGCGYGEFINNIAAKSKHGMDLNPATQQYLSNEVIFHEQDCSVEWQIDANSLDCVFTSNFFEHLPNKQCLSSTLKEAYKALKPDGRLIAMGPNIKFLTGKYWDFYDHHVILTENHWRKLWRWSDSLLNTITLNFCPILWLVQSLCLICSSKFI